MSGLLTTILFLPVAFGCQEATFFCLKTDLFHAFSRISLSDSYSLVPGLSFDRRTDAPRSLASVQPRKDISVADVYSSAERVFRSHSLFWNVLPGLDVKVSEGKDGKFVLGIERSRQETDSRTFGKFGMMRRMRLIMLPIMYKLGVITTLLTLLTVFALKGLTLGVLLLVMSTAGLVAKFKHGHYSPHSGWSPGKDVHIHVHGGGHVGGHSGGGYSSYSSPVHYDDPWVREDKRPGEWIQHQPPPQPPPRSTHSPWASYIGDHAM